MNALFIKIILFIFYFTFFGLIVFIYKLFNRVKKKKNSYWEKIDKEESTVNYFKSPY
jgi:hypothetical protein